MKIIPEQDKIIQLLNILFPNAKIYLFGSRARKTNKPESDIDLAVDVGRRLSVLERAQAKNVIEALNIAQTVDIVDMFSIPEELKQTILKEGILLT